MKTEFEKAEEELYKQYKKSAGTPISKMALKNIRKAAKTMLGAGAKINNSTVADFIGNIDNSDLFKSTEKGSIPPKYQSISNNSNFKNFISFFVVEQNKRLAKKRGKKPATATDNQPPSGFPLNTLDSKTRAYVRMLEMQVKSLENEKKNITSQLQERSKKQPISLGLSYKESTEKGLPTLEMVTEKSSSNALLEQILSKVATLPAQFPEYFLIESRGDKTVLKIASNSRKQVLFRSDEWKFITDTFTGDEHE